MEVTPARELNGLKKDVVLLGIHKASLEAQIAKLQRDIANVEKQIAGMHERIGELEGEVNATKPIR